MTVKFMPVWFADVVKTEERLSEYAAKGLMLSDFKPWGRFKFSEAEPAELRFRICRSRRCGGKVPKKLIESGWKSVSGSKNYYITAIEKDKCEKLPSYSSWSNLYRIIMAVISFFMCYFVGFMAGFLGSVLSKGTNGKKTGFAVIMLAAALVFVFAFVKICRSGKKLKTFSENSLDLDLTVPKENFLYTKEKEKQMLKSGEMIKKSLTAWYLDPVKIEKTVEEMAENGWKFYRLSKWGTTFYYVKSEPCKIKFVVDYQNHATDEYFEMAKSDGWKLEFTSFTRVTSFCVWTKEYTDAEDEPEFYSDSESGCARSRNLMLSLVITAALCDIIFGAILYMIISHNFEDGAFDWFMAAFSTVVIVEFTYVAVMAVVGFIHSKQRK